jgi:competence protein ComEA
MLRLAGLSIKRRVSWRQGGCSIDGWLPAMSRSGTKNDRQTSPWFLTSRQQRAVAVVLLMVQAGLATVWWCWTRANTLVDIDQPPPPREMTFLVDINAAERAELSLLPEVGEVLAGRIVDWRTQHGGFKSIDELRNVRGIGPKTWEKIRPYLAPIGDRSSMTTKTDHWQSPTDQ